MASGVPVSRRRRHSIWKQQCRGAAACRALEGVRVLDFGRVVAGPHCAQMMCAMGADVIKIERPVYGDDSRSDPYLYEPGLSAAFMQQNWGKRSVSLDLRHADAKQIV